ncbi:MAG: hypothetical protein A2001_14195 [Treponema sp. GWC1_61_84]|nr:MAG: hypothetical protein A2001_14195 [Treponema sp. GWC1_61_84]
MIGIAVPEYTMRMKAMRASIILGLAAMIAAAGTASAQPTAAWPTVPQPTATRTMVLPPVQASLHAEIPAVHRGEPFWAALVLELADGWYVYGPDPGNIGLPTRLEWNLPEGFTADAPLFPRATRQGTGGTAGSGYEGRVTILTRIRPPASPGPSFPDGVVAALRLDASWLACKDSCVPGKASLELRLPVAGAGNAAEAATADGQDREGARLVSEALAALPGAALRPATLPGAGGRPKAPALFPFLFALATAFLGGILLNLMPCVLPVISLKVLGLVRRASGGGSAAARSLVYAAGIVGAFLSLAVVLLVLRAGGRSVGWGFQFQNPAVVSAAALLFFMAALNLFGLYEIGLRFSGLAGEAGMATANRSGGLASSFAEGFLVTFAATPCTAPFMGAAMGWAVVQSAPAALAVFFSLGAGMALPYVLVTAHPGLMKRLPAPGPWMETFRISMGFPLAAAALWMARVLGRGSGADAVIRLLASFLACALGAWIWGRRGRSSTKGFARLASGFAALVLVGFGAAAALRSSEDWGVRTGEVWSPERVSRYLAQGRPVFVDFTAEWCLSCKVNEVAVLDSKSVRQRFREKDVARLTADWTVPDEAIARTLEENGRAGVPLYLLYDPDGGPPRVLPEILTRRIVLDALDELGRSR